MTDHQSTMWRDFNRKLDKQDRKIEGLYSQLNDIKYTMVTRKQVWGVVALAVPVVVGLLTLMVFVGDRMWG